MQHLPSFSRLAAVVFACSVFGALPAIHADTVVGTLPGDFSVDNKGSGNYSIPLSVPPGRNGMAPKVALNYSSAGGNGTLGLGFSLSTGFPQAITRGRTILARDGQTRGVTFDDTNADPNLRDKFYLDGKRLICVSGTYGSPGSTYRTEVDSFVSIEATGTGGNIETFVITDKSASKMTFGKLLATTDGYQCGIVFSNGAWVADTLANSWALKRVEDAVGNSVDLQYTNAGQGEYLLASIDYTANTAANLTAQFRVRFVYDISTVGTAVARLDQSVRFSGGRSFAERSRLDRIIGEVGPVGSATITSQYDLKYGYSTGNAQTRLLEVGAMLRNPTTGTLDSVNPTKFDWEASDWSYTTVENRLVDSPTADDVESHAFADVNGDGRDEFIDFRTNGAINVSVFNGSTFGPAVNWISANTALWSGPKAFVRMCDINGDGKKDILFMGYSLNATVLRMYALVSTGDSFVPLGAGNTPTLVFETTDEFEDPPVSVPQTSSPTPDAARTKTFHFLNREKEAFASRISVADFNGDGRDDVLVHRYDGRLQIFRSTGTAFAKQPLAYIGADYLRGAPQWDATGALGCSIRFLGFKVSLPFNVSPMPCDLNGDGLTDYVWVEGHSDWGRYQLPGQGRLSMVNAFKNVYAATSLPGGGFSTAAYVTGAAWNWANGYHRDYPTGPLLTNVLAHRANTFAVMPVDVNGDGLTDIVTLAPAEENDASVYNNGGFSASRQRMLRLQVKLSQGSPGVPSFASTTDMIYGEQTNTTPINVGDVLAYPWFDKIKIGQWVNDFYEYPDRMTDDTEPLLFASAISSSSDNITMTDVNGDGKADYVWYCDSPGSTGWWVMYNQGAKFSAPTQAPLEWYPTESFPSGTAAPILKTRSGVDLNGDGIPDYSYFSASYTSKPGVQGFHISSGHLGQRITLITDGLGRTVKVTYKPITDDSVYTPGAAVTYPIRESRNATFVVSELEKDSGSAVPAHFSYQYSGNRLDLSGRGGLGFHSFVTLDRQTNLFKYQFLAQSFPMTGLTAREQTYRYWPDGANVKFRLVNSHDNTVVFDEVDNGATDLTRRYATVYPFISQAIEYRWEDSNTAHFTYTSAGSPESKSELLFSEKRPGGGAGAHPPAPPPVGMSAQSWFDNQTSVQTTLPGSYKAGDRSVEWSADAIGANTVAGSTSYSDFHTLFDTGYRKITYGNLKKLTTDFGDGFTETVENTYKAPAGVLTGLVEAVKTTVVSPVGGPEVAPIKSYVYSDGTPLVISEKVDAGAAGVTNPDVTLTTTTTYTRDSLKPWLVTATTINGHYNPGSEGASVLGTVADDNDKARHIGSFDTARNSAFDAKWDLPTSSQNAYPYLHTTTTAYHTLLGLPTSVTDVNGVEITTEYDALGRKTKVSNQSTGIKTTYEYRWTLPAATDWTKEQPVNPPEGVTGVAPGARITGVSAVAATSAYAIRTETTVQAPVTAYYDRLGRVIRTVKEGFNGQQTYTDTVYNTLGQTIAVSLPYLAGTPRLWTTTTYDALGRVVTVTAPNLTTTTNTYAGRTTKVTVDALDRDPQTNATLVDAKGRTIKVWNPDPVSGVADTAKPASIEYVLDGFGRMVKTILEGDDSPGRRITATYDALGRQTSLDDPDKGPWTYVNNALGHVVKQTDAKGTVTRSTFDRLGRPLSRKTTETAGLVETADWYYYCTATEDALHRVGFTTQGWIGAPQRETAQTNDAPGYGDPGTASIHYYNEKGLPHLNLNLADGKYFYTAHGYDTYWRPAKVSYFWRPSGYEDAQNLAGTGTPSATPYYWQDWGYTYTYDAPDGDSTKSKSYLLTMADTAGRTWWQADSAAGYDHLDRPVKVRKGDGHWTVRTYRPTDGLLTGLATGPTKGATAIQNLAFDYDGLGNLKQRKNDAISKVEDLTYDSLNRLSTAVVGSSSAGTTYAANGNITGKTAVDGIKLTEFVYSATKPHAVTDVKADGVPYHYEYDANGNLTTRTGGGHNWSARWAGFDKPRWLIDEGPAGAKGDEFTYNANRSRVVHLSIDTVTGSGATATPSRYSRKKVYGLGPQLEADYRNDAPKGSGAVPAPIWKLEKLRIYVPGPEGTAGTMEFNPGAPFDRAQTALVYHYDHLGSIERITPYGSTSTTYVLDGVGKQSRYSYDAWGQRRDPNDWSGKPETTADGGADDATPRGYTGHEMLDDLGLVHMNGRIYDPLLGRFLSADLVVQNPSNRQDYNRYSYVQNNPLTLVDPSGFTYQAFQTQADINIRLQARALGVEKQMDAGRTKAALITGGVVAGGLAVAKIGVAVVAKELATEGINQVGEATVGAPVADVVSARGMLKGGWRAVANFFRRNADEGVQAATKAAGDMASDAAGKVAGESGQSAVKQVDEVKVDVDAGSGATAANVDPVTAPTEAASGGLVRAVPQDQVGTSQAFKLRKGETGLSTFEGVTPEEVLAELPGGRVPNTTVTIPTEGLPPGTTVVPTPAPGLSEKLSQAHREIVPPPDMSDKGFAKFLKKLVGWGD